MTYLIGFMFVFKAMRSFWMILEALESTTACAKVTFFDVFFVEMPRFSRESLSKQLILKFLY